MNVLPSLLVSFEPPHDKTSKMACVPSEDTDQPGHPPSLIRVFAVRMKKAWVLSYPLNALRRLRSDWADAQAYLSLRWAHSHFVGFVMRRLIYYFCSTRLCPSGFLFALFMYLIFPAFTPELLYENCQAREEIFISKCLST